MTEPHAGSDPTQFTTRAVRDGADWVINGWKFFSSNASTSAFLIVMAVTDPDVSPYKGMSMFLVPTDTPGVNIERNIGLGGERLGEGHHALIHYADVRVPADALLGGLGGEGQAFVIAQTRLGGGRIHHAMRTIGLARKALDMMCERALSRTTQGSVLADKQFVQGYIADSYAQLTQFRLLVLYTAWSIDKHKDYHKVRKDIATVKVVMPGVLHDIAQRALQVHGALGASNEMPFHRPRRQPDRRALARDLSRGKREMLRPPAAAIDSDDERFVAIQRLDHVQAGLAGDRDRRGERVSEAKVGPGHAG